MSRLVDYCNTTTDLQNACKQIEQYAYQNLDTTNFQAVSGQDYSQLGQVGFIGSLFINTIEQSVATSASAINSSNTWYYDSDNDILYLYTSLISDNDITFLSASWDEVKEYYREKASQELESYLPMYNRPLPFARGTSKEYDADITRIVALITCRLIVANDNLNNPLVQDLWDQVYAEDVGLLWQYRNGVRAFSFEATTNSLNGLITPVSVSGSGGIEVAGQNHEDDYYVYEIEITTGGEVGDAKYQLTKNDVVIGTFNSYLNYVNLASCNIYIRLYGTFTIGDKWKIEFDGRLKRRNETGLWVANIER